MFNSQFALSLSLQSKPFPAWIFFQKKRKTMKFLPSWLKPGFATCHSAELNWFCFHSLNKSLSHSVPSSQGQGSIHLNELNPGLVIYFHPILDSLCFIRHCHSLVLPQVYVISPFWSELWMLFSVSLTMARILKVSSQLVWHSILVTILGILVAILGILVPSSTSPLLHPNLTSVGNLLTLPRSKVTKYWKSDKK